MISVALNVRDHIPLEQGLRRPDAIRDVSHDTVRDHIPLEQGLRPLAGSIVIVVMVSETIFH